MDIKVVWILSNYPFRGKTEEDSNNGKMSEGQIIMGNIILFDR